MFNTSRVRVTVAAALVAAAIGAAGAQAASPRQQQYTNPVKTSPAPGIAAAPSGSGGVKPGAVATTTTGSTQGLPFTGLQLGSAVALAAVLVAAGFGARRYAARQKG